MDDLECYVMERFDLYVKSDTQYRKLLTLEEEIKYRRDLIVESYFSWFLENEKLFVDIEYVYDDTYFEDSPLNIMSEFKDEKIIIYLGQIQKNREFESNTQLFIDYLKLHELFHMIEEMVSLGDIKVSIRRFWKMKERRMLFSSEILADAFAIKVIKWRKENEKT